MAIPVFKGLSFACFAYCASNLCKWLFLTTGNTHRLMYVNILRFFIFSTVILYFSRSGIVAVSYAYAFTELILRIPTIYYSKLGLSLGLWEIVKSQLAPIITSFLSVVPVYMLWERLNTDNLILFLLIAPTLYFFIFFIFSIKQKFIQEFLSSIAFFENLRRVFLK